MTSTINTLEDWQNFANSIELPSQSFINGHYTNSLSGESFININPANGQVLNNITECSKDDVDITVKSARDVFNKGNWSKMAPGKRKKIMLIFSELISKHSQELALLETLDMGKPINDSVNVDLPSTVRTMQWHAEAIDKIYDEVAPTGNNSLATITREAIGVVAAIVPWNFPLLMACWKIAPVLAMGNSIILKPSEKSSMTAIRIAELASEAGIPDGVFNVLTGHGHTVGAALAEHMDIDCITFTGSTQTGKQLLISSGQSNMKRVWLECGGKAPNIIFADTDDIDKAATSAAWGIFFNQGEVCTAGSRLLVEKSIEDVVLEKIQAIGETICQPGNPLDPKTRVGAIVDDIQTQRVLNYIDIGKQSGANLVFGGHQINKESGGFYIQPTVFNNVENSMRIAQEEIFGPVLSTITFESPEEALKIANDSIYGLSASVWTSNLKKAHSMAKNLRAGTVSVNSFNEGDATVPFGGFKQSGNGRDKSLHAMDKYSELKTTWFDLS